VESCLALDVDRLRRAGRLEPGRCGDWHWPLGGGRVAAVGTRAEPGRLVLTRPGAAAAGAGAGAGGRERVPRAGEEVVPVVEVPCRLGGVRPYFLCPGEDGAPCGRRVARLLHGPGRGRFLCRRCLGLAYASQGEDPLQRAHRRAAKAWRRVGGDPFAAFSSPLARADGERPNRHQRLLVRALAAQGAAGLAFIAWAERMSAGLDRRAARRKGGRR
jgi:hypothetical protein